MVTRLTQISLPQTCKPCVHVLRPKVHQSVFLEADMSDVHECLVSIQASMVA